MKKKFVKVMLFGALALATTATVTSCKDYDDDVSNLQEQIDKITSNNPVSVADMKAAVNAAKSELETQLATVKSNLENKDAQISELTSKISNLEKVLENAADKEAVNELTTELTNTKNDLSALQSLQASDIEKLEDKISELEGLSTDLESLKATFATKAELANYVESQELSGIISQEIVDALGDNGKIATAINDAIQTKVLVTLGGMSEVAKLAGADGTVADVIKNIYDVINNDKTGILAKLVELKDYQDALETKAVAEGFESVEKVIAKVKELQENYTQLYASDQFKNAVNTEVASIINAQLKDADTALGGLKQELVSLGIAINSMIQSVVFIPSTVDRSVDFYTLYAKTTDVNSADQYVVAAKSVNTQKMEFRISPASAVSSVEDFNKKYTISLNAEERPNWTRSVNEFDVKVESYNAGILTVSLTTTGSTSHAVSLNIDSKEDEDGNAGLTPTHVSSDYLAVIQSNYYLKTAYYTVATAKVGEIVYDAPKAVDFSKAGVLTIDYTTSTDATAQTQTKAFSELNVENIFVTTYSLEGTDKNLFDVSNEKGTAGSVSLKKANEGVVDLIGKNATVKANVALKDNTYTMEVAPATAANPQTLGTVTVIRETKNLSHAYNALDIVWANTDQTKVLPSSEIYRDPSVNIPVADYQALTVKECPTTGVYFVVGSDNELTVNVPAGIAAGDYTAKIVFESVSDGYTVTVTAPVKVAYPALETLTFDNVLWSSSTGVNLELTPTPDSSKPNGITVSYDLKSVFSNYDNVQESLPAGGSIEITIPNKDNFEGLTFTTTTLAFNKDQFKKKDGVTENVKMKAVVKLGTTAVQTLESDITIAKISGTWKAGKTAVTLTDRAATINLADGFVWSDYRGKTMWEKGNAIIGGDNFAANANALFVYGLSAPTFSIVGSTSDKYLTVTPEGKISFTTIGKGYSFVNDYTIKVKVTATSQWGTITGYNDASSIITVTVPKN